VSGCAWNEEEEPVSSGIATFRSLKNEENIMNKSWHLSRRTLLKGVGASVALPWLEGMTWAGDGKPKQPPQRLFCMYIPYGTCTPTDKPEFDIYPTGEDVNFKLSLILASLKPYQKKLSIFKHYSHVRSRNLNAHFAADIWLTGADIRRNYEQQISIDQLVANEVGLETRYPSLVLSSEGGTGTRGATRTVSFNRTGAPVPALNDPRFIFDRLFGEDSATTLEQKQRNIRESRSVLDAVLDSSKSLRLNLGRQDQRKLDAYMTSVREVERRISLAQQWLTVSKPEVNSDDLQLDVSPDVPTAYVDTMLHLSFLALQTDSTRVITYQLGAEQNDKATRFPVTACGLKKDAHNVGHHGEEKGEWDAFRTWETWRAERLAGFVQRMAEAQEGEGSLLDYSMVLYGAGSSSPHDHVNTPNILIGGEKIGLRQGRFYNPKPLAETSGLENRGNRHATYNPDQEQPLSRVFRTMLDCFNIEAEHLNDSKGLLSELRA